MGEPLINRRFQVVVAMESSSTDHPSCNQSEESFDLIQPGTAGRGEVKREAIAFLWLQPALHLGAFVRAVVVQNELGFPARSADASRDDSENAQTREFDA